MKKSVKLYSHENVLEEFYSALADKDGKRILEQVHIPKSDVFYVRAAIETDTGVRYTLDRVERAMYLEGMLNRRDVFEPDIPREWET